MTSDLEQDWRDRRRWSMPYQEEQLAKLNQLANSSAHGARLAHSIRQTEGLASTEIWTPEPGNLTLPPGFLPNASPCLLKAIDLITLQRSLYELHWREFEQLIADLLESDGWSVELTVPRKDGGFDVVAIKVFPECGPIKALWQAKKNSPSNKVDISTIRELGYVRDQQGASKGIVVTTSTLTCDAIAEVQQDQYRFDYMEGQDVEDWVRRELGE